MSNHHSPAVCYNWHLLVSLPMCLECIVPFPCCSFESGCLPLSVHIAAHWLSWSRLPCLRLAAAVILCSCLHLSKLSAQLCLAHQIEWWWHQAEFEVCVPVLLDNCVQVDYTHDDRIKPVLQKQHDDLCTQLHSAPPISSAQSWKSHAHNNHGSHIVHPGGNGWHLECPAAVWI